MLLNHNKSLLLCWPLNKKSAQKVFSSILVDFVTEKVKNKIDFREKRKIDERRVRNISNGLLLALSSLILSNTRNPTIKVLDVSRI